MMFVLKLQNFILVQHYTINRQIDPNSEMNIEYCTILAFVILNITNRLIMVYLIQKFCQKLEERILNFKLKSIRWLPKWG